MKVFISYATEDLERFNIPKIASTLEESPNIERVYYWERDCDSHASIISYMEQAINNSEALIVVSTEASQDSGPVNNEIDLAIYQNKRFVPIYVDFDHVRSILKPKRGVKFDTRDFSEFINKLYRILTGEREIISNLEELDFSSNSENINEENVSIIVGKLDKKYCQNCGNNLEKFDKSRKIYSYFCSKCNAWVRPRSVETEKKTKKQKADKLQESKRIPIIDFQRPKLENVLKNSTLKGLRDIASTFNFLGRSKPSTESELRKFLIKEIKSHEFENNDPQLTYSIKELLKLILDNENLINEHDLKAKYDYTNQTYRKNFNILFDLTVISEKKKK